MNWQNRRMVIPPIPIYVARANARSQFLARRGIDNALARHNLDAIVAPHLTNSTGPAVSGYPNLSLPVGIRPPSGKPAAMLMYSTFLHEPKLIGLAYDLEQRMQVRRQPQFLGSVIPVPNADLCDNRAERLRCSLEQRRCRRTPASGKTETILQLEHASRMTILLA